MTPRTENAPLVSTDGIRLHQPVIARAFSLALCAAVVAVLAIFSGAAMREDALLVQAIMPIIVAALGAGVAHGVGYVPRNVFLARLISPIVAWPLMLSALAFLVLRSA